MPRSRITPSRSRIGWDLNRGWRLHWERWDECVDFYPSAWFTQNSISASETTFQSVKETYGAVWSYQDYYAPLDIVWLAESEAVKLQVDVGI